MSKTPRINYREMRKKMGLNQQEFWSLVGVTQSGGSRYESGRSVPVQVVEQVRLRHELGIDTSLITADNAALIKAVLEGGMKVGGNERTD